MSTVEYLPLEALAATLGLPSKFLRGLAGRGDIPALDVNGRLRFDESAVREALTKLASRKQKKRKGAAHD
jgi:hypothetical protein